MKAKIKLIKADDPCEVIELCPECNSENVFKWDVKKFGYMTICSCCGLPMMLCDECQHRDRLTDEPCECNDYCDWHMDAHYGVCKNDHYGICFRGKYFLQEAEQNA